MHTHSSSFMLVIFNWFRSVIKLPARSVQRARSVQVGLSVSVYSLAIFFIYMEWHMVCITTQEALVWLRLRLLLVPLVHTMYRLILCSVQHVLYVGASYHFCLLSLVYLWWCSHVYQAGKYCNTTDLLPLTCDPGYYSASSATICLLCNRKTQ